MGKDYGETIRYDPRFNGPIHNRSCTDILWLIIFVVYLGLWGYVGFYSIQHGNLEKLLAPIDSHGRRCGLDSGLENKKYLVFFDIQKCLSAQTPLIGCPTPQVCVEKCPDENINFEKELLTSVNFEALKSKMVCLDSVNKATMTVGQARGYIADGSCAANVLQSTAVLFRCIGDLSALQCGPSTPARSSPPRAQRELVDTCVRNPKEAQKSLLNRATVLDTYVGWIVASGVAYFKSGANDRDTQIMSSMIVEDLVQSRFYLAGGLVAVVILCFIYILLLRWVVGPVVWGSIIGLFGVLGFSLYLCYMQYQYYRVHTVSLSQTNNIAGYAGSWFQRANTWLVILIVLAIATLILLLIVIFIRSRIVIAIALIKEGSKAVMAVKSTVFMPIFPWILQCGIIAYGLAVGMHLVSIGESTFSVVNLANDTSCECSAYKDYDSCQPLEFLAKCGDCKEAICHFTGLDNPKSVMVLHLANLLGLFWALFFISGVADMVLASTFSTWYWTFHKRDVPYFTLFSGLSRTFRYHLGTVALGSLIIAIVRVIRVILEYIDQKLKKFDNPFTRCVLCCCKCFFWCLESFLKFINKNAYIMCAVHGKNFCTSARDAFSLLLRNVVRVIVLDKVMDFIFFLAKLLISIGVGFAVYYLLQWRFVYDVTQGERLNSNYVPAIILGVAAYIVSTIFFNVYSMAVDTLFLCFLEDCERNDGSAEKPYFMSKSLMKILGKHNQKNKRE